MFIEKKYSFGLLIIFFSFYRMIVVIIFATNSYANEAIRRTTRVVKKNTQNGRDFINCDLMVILKMGYYCNNLTFFLFLRILLVQLTTLYTISKKIFYQLLMVKTGFCKFYEASNFWKFYV